MWLICDFANHLVQDLGLGVLEETKPSRSEYESEDSVDSSGEDADVETEKREKNVLGTLLGQKKRRKLINIQEVGDD
jgi:hypothetical protein